MKKILPWLLCLIILSIWIWFLTVAPDNASTKNPTGSDVFRAIFMIGCGLVQLDLIIVFFFMRSLYKSYKRGQDRALVITIISSLLLLSAIVSVLSMVYTGSWLYVKLMLTPLVCTYFLWRCLHEKKMAG